MIETSLFAEARNQGDDFANAADSFVNNVLSDWLPYAQNVANANAGAAHNSAGALNTLLTSARNAETTNAQDNRQSTKTYKLAIVGSEDGLMSAYAADRKGQSVLNAVNNYNNIAATPLSNFNSQIGQTSSGGMAMGMGMGTGRPSSDDDYIAWAGSIAGIVNSVGSSSSSGPSSSGPPAPPTPSSATLSPAELAEKVRKTTTPTIDLVRTGSGGVYHVYSSARMFSSSHYLGSVEFTSDYELPMAGYIANRIRAQDQIAQLRSDIKHGAYGVEVAIRMANEPLDTAMDVVAVAQNPSWSGAAMVVVPAAGAVILRRLEDITPPLIPGNTIISSPQIRFASFDALKRSLGPAGNGRQWHHIVEQSKIKQFGPEAIHNVDNVISIPVPIHYKITGYYNSIQRFSDGKTVRQWLDGQAFEIQREFGINILRQFGVQ